MLVFNVYLFVYLAGNHPLGLKIGFVNNEGTCPENFQLNELKNPGNYSCAFISELVKEGLDMVSFFIHVHLMYYILTYVNAYICT